MFIVTIANIKSMIYFGFTSILFLMLAVIIIGSYQTRSANEAMAKIIGENTQKIEYAHNMREAIRLRESSMNLMIATNDMFVRDAERMRFYNYAKIYREAREKLFLMPMTETEKELHSEIKVVTQTAQPLNENVADLLAINAPFEDINDALQDARAEQQKLLGLLTGLIELQKEYAHAALLKGRENYDHLQLLELLLGSCVVLVAISIIRYISIYVAAKNEELLEKNKELATASQEAVEATQAKSEFLATMSHEIRTPLTSIIGYAEAALDKDQMKVDPASSIKTIIRSGKHLLQIINDILDLSKIEANKLEIERISLSLFELLLDIESLMSGFAKEKGIEFLIQYKLPLPTQINSDPTRLKQILLNLCGNAIKFTSQGHVIIKVTYDVDNQGINFVVADTGIGMTPVQCSNVFEAYTQADSSTTRKYGGTGLGLTLTKEFIKMLNGTVSVESEKGLGTRFEFTINACVEDNTDLIDDESDIIKNKNIGNQAITLNKLQGHVLLVEDNQDNQRLLSLFINNFGLSVDIADNGKIAVDKALENEYDLILMDMQMPVMNGIEATQHLRNRGYNKPIIALTANAMKQEQDRFYKSGCDDFVTKPIDRRKLRATLSKYVLQEEDSINSSLHSTLLEDGPEYIKIIETFIQKLPTMVENIKQSIRNNKWENISSIAHLLKGSGKGFGYQAITDIAIKLENTLADNKLTEVNTVVTELEGIVSRISKDFQHYNATVDDPNASKETKIRA